MEKEHRKFKRFDAYMNVKFRSHQSKSDEGQALSTDLSREGMKLNTSKPLRDGALVDLEIQVPDDPRPIRTTGKIMWSKKKPGEAKSYDSGVCFVMIDPVDKFRALDYAYNYWLETKVNDYADPEEISEIA